MQIKQKLFKTNHLFQDILNALHFSQTPFEKMETIIFSALSFYFLILILYLSNVFHKTWPAF